jgi:hypothetical protein
MSALGHKRTFAAQKGMSALPPIADICSALAHVRFVPIADIIALFERSHIVVPTVGAGTRGPIVNDGRLPCGRNHGRSSDFLLAHQCM